MNKLVEKVNWNLPNSPSQQLYMYGEAKRRYKSSNAGAARKTLSV